MMNKQTKGMLLTLLGGSCWGLSGSAGEYLFTKEGMESTWLVPIRLGMASFLLLLFWLCKNRQLLFRPWRKKEERIDLIIYGLLGVSFCQFFYFQTIQLSSAAIATILQDLSPVFILFVSCILEKRKPLIQEIIAIILAMIGVLLLVAHGQFSSLAISSSALISGVLSAVCVTIYNVKPKKLMKAYPVSLLQGWAFFMGSITFCLLFQPWNAHYMPSLTGWLGIAFVVVIGNILAFTCYMKGVSYIGASKAILYGFSEPVTAAIVSFLFLHTSYTFYDFLGFLCVFGMLFLISKNGVNQKQ